MCLITVNELCYEQVSRIVTNNLSFAERSGIFADDACCPCLTPRRPHAVRCGVNPIEFLQRYAPRRWRSNCNSGLTNLLSAASRVATSGKLLAS
jgi:hypothetical protein